MRFRRLCEGHAVLVLLCCMRLYVLVLLGLETEMRLTSSCKVVAVGASAVKRLCLSTKCNCHSAAGACQEQQSSACACQLATLATRD
jgi:hypothetical protein